MKNRRILSFCLFVFIFQIVCVCIFFHQSFARPFNLKLFFNAGYQPMGIDVGDINLDGHQDLAVANYSSGSDIGSVSILLGMAGDTFHERDPFWPAKECEAARGPRAVAIGKLDGDAYPDLAVANSYSDEVSVIWWNDDTLEDPCFDPVDYNVGDQPWDVAIGDFNEDDHKFSFI